MSDKKTGVRDTGKQERPPGRKLSGRLLRYGAVILAAAVLLYLAAWLVERSLRTPAKKRAMQAWLDETMNADVSLLGEMVVRLNVVRKSRLFLHQTEIEHPNPVFPGKFARIDRIGAWVPPWSLAGLMSGQAYLLFTGVHLAFEQGQFGEWSHDGLMRPLAAGNNPFPFPMPKISGWNADIESSSLSIKRRGYELVFDINGQSFRRPGRDRIGFRSDRLGFTIGRVDVPESRLRGVLEAVNLFARWDKEKSALPLLLPGHAEARVSNLPLSILPFLVDGIPVDRQSGAFSGVVRYNAHNAADGALFLEGQLSDVPLAVFGLPPHVPLRLNWPIHPNRDNVPATLHMGPSGYGAFEISATLDQGGSPKAIALRGDVAALDSIPALFSQYSAWPQWLSRISPVIEWQTGAWRGFGWEGTDLRLYLTRSTAGLNLTGEANMMNGRVRIAVTPDQEGAPISIAAEKLDASQLSRRLSRHLPEPFQAPGLSGSPVNLTWRGIPSETGGMDEWGSGMVWAKPVLDRNRAGDWWRGLTDLPSVFVQALPEWGGGDPGELERLADIATINFDQLSIVLEQDGGGAMHIEFRAYGDSLGQATGLVERRRDGSIEGEVLFAGPSLALRTLGEVNQDFALALDLLANESPGLRVAFEYQPGGEVVFHYPFLENAKRIREELERNGYWPR
ncbi:MAG: hypothetical protein LIQ30_07820 [Planctomycetes bacterium]|nr:hypothetical protein [Planctomycetota bacterium]